MPRAKAASLHASPDDAEQQFYETLREADLEKLMSIWAEDEEVVCIHPGGPRMVGHEAVRVAFEAVFATGAIRVQPTNVRRLRTMDSAVHSVVEQVELRTDEGVRVGYVMATNVYSRTAEGWRLVMHHASPGTPHEPSELLETPSVLH
jgi:uncharacterized protein (TIGR02246 family)